MLPRALTAALLAALASLALAAPSFAAGELPRLGATVPSSSTERFWFDDHSVSGDNHLSWSPAGGDLYYNDAGQPSQREPQGIRFDETTGDSGAGALEVCGYPSGTPGWMRAYQIAPGTLSGSCPPDEPASGQFGWFRYVFGRHSPTGEFNRWHLMDFERFALVPLPADQGGPTTATPTVWDNHWGTCLNFGSPTLGCEPGYGAGRLDVGIASGGAQLTQSRIPDSQIIPIPVDLQPSLPNARYQVVALTNPYGLIKEQGGAIGGVSCVNVTLTIGVTGYGEVAITPDAALPATCYVPTALDPALTGPSGFDPMGGAEAVPSCTFMVSSGHCWATPPHPGPNIAAHSLATGDPTVIPSTALAQGSAIPEAISATGRRIPPPRTVPSGGAPSTVTPSAGGSPTTGTSATTRAINIAKTRARGALRRVFGTGLTRLSLSCRLRSGDAATCTVSWRKRGGRYSGHVYLRNKLVRGLMRWQYRIDVTRRKNGRTTHVRLAYRTGGLA